MPVEAACSKLSVSASPSWSRSATASNRIRRRPAGDRRRGALDLTLRTGLSATDTYSSFQTGLTRKSDDLTLPIVAVICIISLSLSISQIAASRVCPIRVKKPKRTWPEFQPNQSQ